jgi:hypothetical protein
MAICIAANSVVVKSKCRRMLVKDKPLNNKTPKWFKDWHCMHFKPVRNRTVRNERWVYIILIAIIGSGILADGNTNSVIRILDYFLGG